jgi:hypothetical protein
MMSPGATIILGLLAAAHSLVAVIVTVPWSEGQAYGTHPLVGFWSLTTAAILWSVIAVELIRDSR